MEMERIISYFGKQYMWKDNKYTLQCVMPVSRDAMLSDGTSWFSVPYKDFDFDAYIK